MMTEQHIIYGVLIIVALAGMQAVNELVKLFFQRMRTSDMVTKEELRIKCERCQLEDGTESDAMGKRVEAIAKLVLAMAIKMGIDTKDIQGIL